VSRILLPTPDDFIIFPAVHLVEAGVVAAAVAFETRGGFEGVEHEAKARAGGYHG
ncbi:MAG: hypothetical protein Q9173_005995, partial [Seirophora scorigena]